MVSKHELPMTEVKEAAGETHYMDCGLCTGFYYNTDTGRIYADTQASCKTWAVWQDDCIIPICNVNHRMTMQQTADRISMSSTESSNR